MAGFGCPPRSHRNIGYPYNSAYLLSELKRLVGRTNIADAITTASYYERLTEAQDLIVADVAAICPEVLYPTVTYASIPQMSTADGGLTFTYGTDSNGFPLAPIGKVSIYKQLIDIPDNPLVPLTQRPYCGLEQQLARLTCMPRLSGNAAGTSS